MFLNSLLTADLHMDLERFNTLQMYFSAINYASNYVIVRNLVYTLSVYLFISKYGCSFPAGVDS